MLLACPHPMKSLKTQDRISILHWDTLLQSAKALSAVSKHGRIYTSIDFSGHCHWESERCISARFDTKPNIFCTRSNHLPFSSSHPLIVDCSTVTCRRLQSLCMFCLWVSDEGVVRPWRGDDFTRHHSIVSCKGMPQERLVFLRGFRQDGVCELERLASQFGSRTGQFI